jgi:hypothetical protein
LSYRRGLWCPYPDSNRDALATDFKSVVSTYSTIGTNSFYLCPVIHFVFKFELTFKLFYLLAEIIYHAVNNPNSRFVVLVLNQVSNVFQLLNQFKFVYHLIAPIHG